MALGLTLDPSFGGSEFRRRICVESFSDVRPASSKAVSLMLWLDCCFFLGSSSLKGLHISRARLSRTLQGLGFRV